MSVQTIFGHQTLSNDDWPLTCLNGLMGSTSQHDPESLPIAGSFGNWFIELTAAPGGVVSRTWTFYKNGIATAAQIVITGSATTGSYTGTAIHYNATDTIYIRAQRSAIEAAANTRHAFEWTPDDGVSFLYGFTGGTNPGEDGITSAINGTRGFIPTDFRHACLVGTSGTITALRIKVRTAPGVGKSRVFNYVLAGVDQDGTGGTVDTRLTISGTNTAGTLTFSLPVTSGQSLAIRQTQVSAPTGITWSSGVMAFTPTNPDIFQTAMTGDGANHTGSIRYTWPNADVDIWDGTTPADRSLVGGIASVYVHGMVAEIAQAAAAGKSWTFTLYKNTVATSVVVTIAGATDTTGSITVFPPIEIAPGDRWTIGAIAVGSPTGAGDRQRISLGVGLEAPTDPVVQTRSAAGIQHDKATLRGRIDPNDFPSMNGYFVWGLAPDALVNTTAPVSLGGGGSVFIPYSTQLTGLTSNTTYYFQAIGNSGSPEFFGEILSFTTLGEQLFVDGEVSHPLTYIGLQQRDETNVPFAEVDLNDPLEYEYGYKAPYVVNWLPITRGFSDRTGQIEHMAFGALLSDTAHYFRALLDDVTNRFLTNRPLWEKMIDDESRRLLGLWRYVANGFVSDYEPRSPLLFQITGCDWLKKKFSRKAKAQRAWQPTITVDDFPNCPKETLGLAAPLIYGRVDDGIVQSTEVSTTLPTNSSYPAVSNNAASDIAGGSLNGRVWVYGRGVKAGVAGPIVPYVGAGTVDYNRSVLFAWDRPVSDPTFFDSYEIFFVGGDGASVNWEDFSPETGARAGSGITFVRKLTHDNVVDPTLDGWAAAPWAPYAEMAVILTSNTDGTDALTGVATSSVDLGHGDYLPIYVGIETVDGLPHHKALVCRGAVFAITELYVDGFPQHIATDSTQAGVGGIWKIPGYAGWNALFADPFEDINGTRYTVIYGKAGFPGPDRLTGETTSAAPGADPGPLAVGVTLNVWGFETVGDGSGELITSLPQQQKHFLRNFLAPDTPPLTDWLTSCPTFAHEPTLDLVDETTFDVVEEIWAEVDEAGGSPAGIEGGFVIGANGEFITALDVLAQFHVSGDWNGTFTRKGQFAISMEPATAPLDPVSIDDIINITADSFSIKDLVQTEFFNILPYVHTRDYTGRTKSGWFSTEDGEVDVRDGTSITNYDQERESPVFELQMLRKQTAATVVPLTMGRKLARYKHPLRTAACTVPLSGTQIEVGDIFQFSHIEGIGPTGWSDRLVRTTRHELDPNLDRVRLEVYDVQAILDA